MVSVLKNTLTPSTRKLAAVLLAVALVFIYFSPSDLLFRDSNPNCIHRKLLGIECPGCGMTRAIYSILHSDLKNALRLNFAAVFVFPLLVVEIISGFRERVFLDRARFLLYFASCAALFVLYGIRIFSLKIKYIT
jgi:hypothetical protein